MTVQAIDLKVIEDQKAEQVQLMRKAHDYLEKEGATQNELEDARKFIQQAEEIDKKVKAMESLRDMEMAQNADLLEAEKAKAKEAEEKARKAEDLAGFKHIGEYMQTIYLFREKGVYDRRLEKMRNETRAAGEKDMSGVTGTLGGFLLPTQQREDVLSARAEASRVRNRALVIPMANRFLEWSKLDLSQGALNKTAFFGGIIVYRTAEAQTIVGTRANFKKFRLEASALHGLVYIPIETIQDSPVSLEAYYRGPRGFGGAMAWREDWESIQGGGGAEMLGTLNAPCTLEVSRNSPAHFQFIDAVTMYSKMLLSGMDVIEWDMSQSVIPELMQMEDTNGNNLWIQMAANNVPDRLLGKKINFTEKVPALGTKGDVMLGDYSWYVMGDRETFELDIDKSAKFEEHMIAFKVTERNHGAPWLEGPITLADGETQVSPFVALN